MAKAKAKMPQHVASGCSNTSWAAGEGEPGEALPWPALHPNPVSTSGQEPWDYSHGGQAKPDPALLFQSYVASTTWLGPHQ